MSQQIRLYGCSNVDLYDINTKLGEGTFGQVYQGTFKPNGTAVALKEIIVHERDEGIPITALREIKIMKALKHPNVLHILDMAVKKGDKSRSDKKTLSTYYMVMKYMDHDLCGLLHNKSVRFTLSHIKLYMSQLLQGMEFLHDQQYMHRDIKSANVLVGNDGSIKIADFGLARKYYEAPPSSTETHPAERKYTPKVVTRWYRPPELLLGEQFYTPAIDMWGIGCIFGEFFKRQVIMPGSSDTDQIQQVFKLLGSPSEKNMPNYSILPFTKEIMPIPQYPRAFDNVFNNVPTEARDLLAGFLCYDPMRRLTAKGALKHTFFTEGVQAADPKDLPSFPSSREMDVRRKRQASPPPNNQRKHVERSDRRGGNNIPRAFAPKVWNKRELSKYEQIPPYRRQQQREVRSQYPKETQIAAKPINEPEPMRNGLDY
ncbi:cyclin-dependent serine/threonine protein kinase [Starmerella bacillaris]|uniref:Serine/threonine-protein kinase BUR1 n=1 Tax=Starmerella bacillaris TaxID=1247836 RepID=A0AAV5RLB5_STABA|nr:cyclin-dependent serine/threonine protein kinase [Starmerella bacillaris]